MTKLLTRFDDLTGEEGSLSRHSENQCHKESVVVMENFKQTVDGDNLYIRILYTRNSAKQRSVTSNC